MVLEASIGRYIYPVVLVVVIAKVLEVNDVRAVVRLSRVLYVQFEGATA